jgi:ABC-type nickel/cobalt efflux system permease component RcnA
MPALLAIILLGFILGMRHATDPDHVVAVTTIVSRERTMLHAILIGALWGIGHTVTILLVGSAIILFQLTIPPRVGLGMELSVGLMLILLGVLNLTGVLRRAIEWITIRRLGPGAHSHFLFGRLVVHTDEEGSEPIYLDSASILGWTPQWWRQLGVFHILRPLVVGLVHGLAGSAAVALLVLTTIDRPSWAIGYLLIFGLGTVAGMMLITAAIALPFAYSLQHFMRLNRGLAMASGLVSVAFGLFLCYQTGFVDGLFTAHPSWIPKYDGLSPVDFDPGKREPQQADACPPYTGCLCHPGSERCSHEVSRSKNPLRRATSTKLQRSARMSQ